MLIKIPFSGMKYMDSWIVCQNMNRPMILWVPLVTPKWNDCAVKDVGPWETFFTTVNGGIE